MLSSTTSVLQGIEEKTATLVTEQRNSLLTRLKDTWEKTVAQTKASQKMWSELAPDEDLSRLRPYDTFTAEKTKTERWDQYRDDLAAATFQEEVTRRVANSVKFRIQNAPEGQNGLSKIEFDLGSALASDVNEVQYVIDQAHELVKDHTIGGVQALSLGRSNMTYPAFMAKELVDSIVGSEVIPASKETKGNELSDFDRYISGFKDLTRPEVEAFYDQVTDRRSFRGPTFSEDPLKAFDHTYRPYRVYPKLEGKLPGETIEWAIEDGRVFPSILESAASHAEDTRQLHEKHYTAETGKQLSDVDDTDMFNYMTDLHSFVERPDLVNRLDSLLLSNAQRPDPVPLEDLDMTEAFMQDEGTGDHTGLVRVMATVDKTFSKFFKGTAAPFYSMGAAPDQRPADVRDVKFNLVEESRSDAPKQLSDFWPKSRGEVSGSRMMEEAELPEKYADSLVMSSLLL
ncbi:hypothetical protein IAT38_008427 [Cryptococcus sp. DSM 104549]